MLKLWIKQKKRASALLQSSETTLIFLLWTAKNWIFGYKPSDSTLLSRCVCNNGLSSFFCFCAGSDAHRFSLVPAPGRRRFEP